MRDLKWPLGATSYISSNLGYFLVLKDLNYNWKGQKT